MATEPVVPWYKVKEYNKMRRLMEALHKHPDAFIFDRAVDTKIVTDYEDVIKKPMDFPKMDSKLSNNEYSNMDALVADAQLMFDNCRLYNGVGSNFHRYADSTEAMMKNWLSENEDEV